MFGLAFSDENYQIVDSDPWFSTGYIDEQGHDVRRYRINVQQADPDPTASRVTPSSPITLAYGTNQGFTVRGQDAGGDLWKVEWNLTGPENETDTDDNLFSGSDDTADFTDFGGYTFDTPGNYTLTATVYDDSGDTDSVSWSIHVNDPPKPDLIVQDISISPASPTEGESATITATLRNQGDANASGSIRLIYYVDGSNIGSDELPLGLSSWEFKQ